MKNAFSLGEVWLDTTMLFLEERAAVAFAASLVVLLFFLKENNDDDDTNFILRLNSYFCLFPQHLSKCLNSAAFWPSRSFNGQSPNASL